MKAKTFLTITILMVVAFAFSVPVAAQPIKGGITIRWQIDLSGPNANTWATAVYEVAKPNLAPPPSPKDKVFTKFTVEATTPNLPDGTKLGVFVGPGSSPKDFGKLVGTIDVSGGAGGMLLLSAKAPEIQRGNTVTIVILSPKPGQQNFHLFGKF